MLSKHSQNELLTVFILKASKLPSASPGVVQLDNIYTPWSYKEKTYYVVYRKKVKLVSKLVSEMSQTQKGKYCMSPLIYINTYA